MGLIRVVAVVSVFVVAGATQLQAQPVRNVLRWTVAVPEAQTDPAIPRAHHVYETADSIPIRLTLFNDSPSEIVIVGAEFAKGVDVRTRSAGDELQMKVEWSDAWQKSHEANAWPADRIVLEQGSGVGWIFRIRQADDTPFDEGTYVIELNVAEAVETLTDASGNRWSGGAAPSTDLRVTIAAPATPTERAQRYRLLAAEALNRNQGAEAERLSLAGLKEAPLNLALLRGLADAYLIQNKYRDAIAAYEQLVPMVRGERTGIALLLALAYVAVGDEPNAVRNLRSEGRSDGDVAAQLIRLRDVARRRAGR